jgi:SAM-dependent methyltransferase
VSALEPLQAPRPCSHPRKRAVWGGVLSRCEQCGLVATAQVGDFEYAEDYFVGGERGYDFDSPVSRAIDAARFESELAMLAKRGMRGSVLDIGCAVGTFLVHAKQHGWDVEGVEIADFAREEASRRLGIEIKSDLALLPAGRRYDLVTLHHVLEHIPEPAEFLAHNVAPRVGGMLLIEVPNFASLAAQVHGPRWSDLRPEQHLHHFEPDTLRAIVTAAGFEVRSVYTLAEPLFSLNAGKRLLATLAGLARSRRFGPEDLVPSRHGSAPNWTPPRGLRAAGIRAVHLGFLPLIRMLERTNRAERLVVEAQLATERR